MTDVNKKHNTVIEVEDEPLAVVTEHPREISPASTAQDAHSVGEPSADHLVSEEETPGKKAAIDDVAREETTLDDEDIQRKYRYIDNTFQSKPTALGIAYAAKRTPANTLVTDKDNALKVHAKSDEAVQLVVALSITKGWSNINLSGAKDLKAAIWLEASKQGLNVAGYEPSREDLRKLETFQNSPIVKEDVTQRDMNHSRTSDSMQSAQLLKEWGTKYAATLEGLNPTDRTALADTIASKVDQLVKDNPQSLTHIKPEPIAAQQEITR